MFNKILDALKDSHLPLGIAVFRNRLIACMAWIITHAIRSIYSTVLWIPRRCIIRRKRN